MTRLDHEVEELRRTVDCRVVLERDGWRLDRKESTRKAVKYRRGEGEIIIVIYEGRGWFDPLSDKKGDVFTLAQTLWGGSFGAARAAPRPLAGLSPTPQEWTREHCTAPAATLQARWSRRRLPRPVIGDVALPRRGPRHTIRNRRHCHRQWAAA